MAQQSEGGQGSGRIQLQPLQIRMLVPSGRIIENTPYSLPSIQELHPQFQTEDSMGGNYPYSPAVVPGEAIDSETGYLRSNYEDSQVIGTFNSKDHLKEYVKKELSPAEKCSIVIGSSKKYAIYFTCEKAGHYRTTVKFDDSRQRNAFTKREKCGYKLTANIVGSVWVLKMVHNSHNHAPVVNRRKFRKLVTAIPSEKAEEGVDAKAHATVLPNPLLEAPYDTEAEKSELIQQTQFSRANHNSDPRAYANTPTPASLDGNPYKMYEVYERKPPRR